MLYVRYNQSRTKKAIARSMASELPAMDDDDHADLLTGFIFV